MNRDPTRLLLWSCALTFVLTLLIGLMLRWDLVTATFSAAGLAFPDLRHAHSHVGFYGFLTFAWWLVLRGSATPPTRPALRLLSSPGLGAYAIMVLVASALFAFIGYAWPTIALSTLIALVWALEAWRSRHLSGWLSLPPWGVVLGLVLVPAIAITARRDFALSRDLAHVFIAALLFLTFIPMALERLRVPPVSPLFWALTTLIGSSHLVFVDHSIWPLGLFASLAGLSLALALRRHPRHLEVPLWLRATWWLFSLGLVLIGLVPPLQTHEVRLAALHFTALGPIALTLLHAFLPGRAERRRVVFYPTLLALLVMLGAMLATSLIGYVLAMKVAAIASSMLVLGATLLLWPSRAASGRERTRSSRGA